MPDVNPAVDPEIPQPANNTVPLSQVDTAPKSPVSDAVLIAQQASGTEISPQFGTTAPTAPLVDPEVTIAQQVNSNTTTTDFTGTVPKPVIGDGVVDAQLASGTDSTAFTTGNNFETSYGDPAVLAEAGSIAGLTNSALLQPQISSQQQNKNNNDWRVKLSLAPSSDYLYNSSNPGILQPLKTTGGVIFPYTPQIDTQYRANYSQYDLTHSNYRGYFYSSSYIDSIQVRGTFTAQDTQEANYLLAVIHFFRSVTKMFYGQDAQRGAPPPLVFLSGLGQYQFNNHPCLVQAFNYNLPDGVDYVRAGANSINGTNLLTQRNRNTQIAGGLLGGLLSGALTRLATSGLFPGGNPASAPPPPTTLGPASGNVTYVPTKMDIALTLLPVQSRSQVSQQFSVKGFASGDLLKGGFW